MSIIIICVFIVLFGALVKNILVGQHTRKAIDIIFSKLDWEHLNKIYLEEVSYESRVFFI